MIKAGLARLNGCPPLAIYVMAATLARMATGGSAVAIILLSREYGASGKVAGLLAACLTAPHLFGPVFGRWLDRAVDPRLLLLVAAFCYSVFFQLTIKGFDWQTQWLISFSLLMCGTCSSFLMGGMSTQLTGLVGNQIEIRRRAQGWDTITYGIGTTLGPMLIALLSVRYSTNSAVSLLMLLPILAGMLVLLLPVPAKKSHRLTCEIPGIWQIANMFRTSGPLKRTISMTSGAAFSVAALPVLAVYLGESWQSSKESGAYLVTCYGIGSLCGALVIMVKPLRGEALTLLNKVGLLLLSTLIAVTLSQSYVAGLFTYWLCGAANSLFFAVTLAARSDYAPANGAAQIYMWVAAAKISAASLGALAAGIWVDESVKLPLVFVSMVFAFIILLCFWRRVPL